MKARFGAALGWLTAALLVALLLAVGLVAAAKDRADCQRDHPESAQACR